MMIFGSYFSVEVYAHEKRKKFCLDRSSKISSDRCIVVLILFTWLVCIELFTLYVRNACEC